MKKLSLRIAFAGFFLTTFVVSVWAHPTGVSKVDLTIKGDTLKASVDVNRSDLFYALGFGPITEAAKTDFGALSDRVAYYFQTRLDLKIDGSSAVNMKVLSWRKHGEDPALKMDSASLSDTTIVLQFGVPIPPGAQRLQISSKFFAELELQPISHLRIFYRGQEIKSKFMSLDQGTTQSLNHDSLEYVYTLLTRPTAASEDASPTGQEESVILRFVSMGFTHILPKGMDHILFVVGLFFFSVLLRPLLFQVTAFTIAHSLTLGLSLLGVFSLPSRVVEPLIALSIVVVAIENIFFRKMRPSRFLIVFGFGLIHGLGFAGVLKQLGLPEGQFFKVLISFNLGVELGQLTIIATASALTFWMWKKPWYFKRVVIPVSSTIAAIGLFWFIQRILFLQG